MEFENYLYKQIGVRIKRYRQSFDITQEKLQEKIEELFYENYPDESTFSINISHLENGRKLKDRTFISDRNLEALAQAMEMEKFEVVFGKEDERQKLMILLLYSVLVNKANKINNQLAPDRFLRYLNGTDDEIKAISTEHYFSISTMDGLEKITNLLLKLMLSDLRFQNIFMKHHFLEEKEEPFSEDDFAQFEKENKKLQEWYSKDVGDMVSKIAADPEDWTWLKHTFLTKKALLCDKCFSYFDEQLRELFRSRESYEAKEFFGDKLSNILFKRLSFKHIMKIICSDRMRLYLHELVHYSALDSNSNFFHTRFPHYYQRQKLFMELLVQMKEGNVVSDETYTEYRLQSDIVTLLDKNLITDNAEVLSDTLHSLQLFSIVYPEAADALVE